jgi:hypothetical protein
VTTTTGNPSTLNATVVDQADNLGTEGISVAGGFASSPLQAVASVPFCCDPLERLFSAELDGAALPATAGCAWDFGDERTAEGCEVGHVFPGSGTYAVFLHVSLVDGRSYDAELVVSVGIPEGENESTPSTASDAPGDEPESADQDQSDDTGSEPVESEAEVGNEVESLQIDAGMDREVVPGQLVDLKALVTVTPASVEVGVSWEQVSGPALDLGETNSGFLFFEIPLGTEGAAFVLKANAQSGELTVDDHVTLTVAGVGDVVRADDPQWGFDPADATVAIQNAIDSGAPTVLIPDIGQPWIVRPIMLRSNLHLIMEPGAALEAMSGAYPNATDSVLNAVDIEDVVIDAYGALILMPKEEYIPPFDYPDYMEGEWRNAVNIRGSRRVDVLGLSVDGTGGDAIYISPTWGMNRIHCADITVRECHLARSWRNGITIVSGTNILIDNCTITQTSGRAPQAGLLVEPSDLADNLVNVRVRHCQAIGNAGTGFMTNLSRLKVESDPIDVVIEDCTVTDSVQPGLRAILREDLGATGSFEFRRCDISGVRHAGARVVWDVWSSIRLGFVECSWSNVAFGSDFHVLEFELTGDGNASSGLVEFLDCQVDHDDSESLMAVESVDDMPFSQVVGDISVLTDEPPETTWPQLPNLDVTFLPEP